MNELSGKAAIAGIGATEFSKNSGRSELRLAVEAALAALADAGIDPAEVDGMSTYTMDNNPEIEVFAAARPAPRSCTRPWLWPRGWPRWSYATAL